MKERSRGSTCSSTPPGGGDALTFVHDAPGLFAGLPLILPGNHYTTPQVVMEVRDKESKERLQRVLEAGRLCIIAPSRITAGGRGLSEADRSILSLALELREEGASVVLVTDDYALQKEARARGIEYMPVKTMGFEKANMLTGRKTRTHSGREAG